MEKTQHSPYFVGLKPGLQSEDEYLPPTPRPLSWQIPNPEFKQPKLNWCEDSQKNKPQCNSLAAATLIFISGGMSLAWSLGFSSLSDELNESARTHMQICWFLGAIIGACLGSIFIDTLEKRILNLWASGLVFINGILLVSAPGSSAAIVFARSCDGIAVGSTIIAAIVAGSEQAVKRFRGIVLIAESIGITSGIMLQALFMSMRNASWNISSNQIQGILALILGALALVCTSFLTIETPTFFLRREKEEDAINTLKRLQSPSELTHETYSLLYENRDLLNEDINRGRIENMTQSYLPMLKLCVYRAFVSISFSLPLNWGFLLASAQTVENPNDDWFSLIYGIMRMMGVVVTIFTLDIIGRRVPAAVALLIGSGLLLGVGAVFACGDNLEDETKMQTIIGLLTVYQFFSGVAASASTVYLGEAFSISVKPFFIMMAVIFENVIQIIVSCAFEYTPKSVSDYSFALGALQMVFAICFVFIMPETKQTTLREALRKFKQNINKIWQ